MCDHPLDAVELAGLEEGERRLVGACVPGKGKSEYSAPTQKSKRRKPPKGDRHRRKIGGTRRTEGGKGKNGSNIFT